MGIAKTRTGISLSLVCLFILGVMPVISNSRPDDFDALVFAFLLSVWQTIFAVPLFFRELQSDNRGIFSATLDKRQKTRAFTVTLFTGAMFGASTYLYVLGIEKAGAVNAAIAIQAYPLFAILWESIFLKRRKTPVELLLTATLIAALYFLGTGGTWELEGLSPWFFVALGVPFLWSIAHVIIKEELGRTPITPAQVTLFRVALSAIFLGLILLVVDPVALWTALPKVEFQIFAATMGCAYYLELIVWFYAVRHIDVSFASSITTPWPAVTIVLAAIFLGDKVDAYQIVAFIVVALCIYGLMIAGLRKEQTQKA